MGGMAAQIPIKNNEEANKAAMDKVIADKTREATDGHDGTWVAHPGLVPIAKEIFEKNISGPNQINKQRDDVNVGAKDLLDFNPTSPITESGLRQNISIGIQYIGAWLAGTGCVPIFNLMEDAATAEISRAQIWNWIRSPHGVLESGEDITPELFLKVLPEELEKIKVELASSPIKGQYDKAAEIFKELTLSEDFVDFLTLPAYEEIS
jgi:malate synthase